MKDVIKGFMRFRRAAYPQRAEAVRPAGQQPGSRGALFITCSDSRVCAGIAGAERAGRAVRDPQRRQHRAGYGPEPGGVSATVEYAVAVLGVTDVVICGPLRLRRHVGHRPTAPASTICLPWPTGCATPTAPRRSTRRAATARRRRVSAPWCATTWWPSWPICAPHPSVALAVEQGKLDLHGWVYDIESGGMLALDGDSGRFVQLDKISPHPRHAQPSRRRWRWSAEPFHTRVVPTQP